MSASLDTLRDNPRRRLTPPLNGMTRYVLMRLFGMAVVMFLVLTIVFLIVRVTPGDPAAIMLGPDATAAALRA